MIEYELKKYLESILKVKVTPSFSIGPFPAVAYTFSPVSEGPVKESQLEVRIMGNELDECLEIRSNVINALHRNEQQPSLILGDYVLRPQVAGGGWLFNSETQMWEYPTIFTITWRCKNGR